MSLPLPPANELLTREKGWPLSAKKTPAAIGSGRSAGKQAPVGERRHRKMLRNSIDGVTKPAIRRLARRGGVKRIAGNVYHETRSALMIFLKQIIGDAFVYCDHAHRKTVTVSDVVYSLRKNGRQLYGYGN
jgi:histone H4